MPLPEPFLFLDSYSLAFPSSPQGTRVPVACPWGGRSWLAVLLGLAGCALHPVQEKLTAQHGGKGALRRAPLSSGPPADGNRALVRFLGVASPPRLAARGPRHFRPQLWAVRGVPRRVRTGRGLDLASFRLPLGGATQGAGGLSSRGISMVGVLPALAARAGPLAPASQWPASTPPARSLAPRRSEEMAARP